jgi:hypothetical protein
VSCSDSWRSLSDPVLATRRPLRAEAHLPGTCTSAGHLGGVVAHLAAERLRDENCTPVLTLQWNELLYSSQSTTVWMATTNTAKERRGRGQRAGDDSDHQITRNASIVAYQHHFVSPLHSPATPPNRHGRPDAMTARHR